MDIEVVMRSCQKRAFLEAASAFFEQELKLKKSKAKLLICCRPNLVKEHNLSGMATEVVDKLIVVYLDSKLPLEKTISTLAHEMVHVKQIATGKLKHKKYRGKIVPFWNGKRVIKKYTDRPWEIQAWSKELVLANKLWSIINPVDNN